MFFVGVRNPEYLQTTLRLHDLPSCPIWKYLHLPSAPPPAPEGESQEFAYPWTSDFRINLESLGDYIQGADLAAETALFLYPKIFLSVHSPGSALILLLLWRRYLFG